MNDLISRQDAIDTICNWHCGHTSALCSHRPSVCGFWQALTQLPSAQQWIPCSEPPENDRSVFIAYGNERLKSCCIGYYDSTDKQWREQKNFFATLIYDAKYWCDMPELPERWYE